MNEVQGEQVLQALADVQTGQVRILFALECLIVIVGVLLIFQIISALVRWKEGGI